MSGNGSGRSLRPVNEIAPTLLEGIHGRDHQKSHIIATLHGSRLKDIMVKAASLRHDISDMLVYAVRSCGEDILMKVCELVCEQYTIFSSASQQVSREDGLPDNFSKCEVTCTTQHDTWHIVNKRAVTTALQEQNKPLTHRHSSHSLQKPFKCREHHLPPFNVTNKYDSLENVSENTEDCKTGLDISSEEDSMSVASCNSDVQNIHAFDLGETTRCEYDVRCCRRNCPYLHVDGRVFDVHLCFSKGFPMCAGRWDAQLLVKMRKQMLTRFEVLKRNVRHWPFWAEKYFHGPLKNLGELNEDTVTEYSFHANRCLLEGMMKDVEKLYLKNYNDHERETMSMSERITKLLKQSMHHEKILRAFCNFMYFAWFKSNGAVHVPTSEENIAYEHVNLMFSYGSTSLVAFEFNKLISQLKGYEPMSVERFMPREDARYSRFLEYVYGDWYV